MKPINNTIVQQAHKVLKEIYLLYISEDMEIAYNSDTKKGYFAAFEIYLNNFDGLTFKDFIRVLDYLFSKGYLEIVNVYEGNCFLVHLTASAIDYIEQD